MWLHSSVCVYRRRRWRRRSSYAWCEFAHHSTLLLHRLCIASAHVCVCVCAPASVCGQLSVSHFRVLHVPLKIISCLLLLFTSLRFQFYFSFYFAVHFLRSFFERLRAPLRVNTIFEFTFAITFDLSLVFVFVFVFFAFLPFLYFIYIYFFFRSSCTIKSDFIFTKE